MDILRAIVLGMIEGLTEFLPVSSTGHLIIAEPLLGVDVDSPRWKVFLIVCQLGAIAAVALYFWRELSAGLLKRPIPPSRSAASSTAHATAAAPARIGPTGVTHAGAGAANPNPDREGGARGATPFAGRALSQHLLTKLIVVTLPAMVVGLVSDSWVEQHLKNPPSVAAALIVGAVAIELIDRRYRRAGEMSIENVSLKQSLWVGVAQCASIIWPGISRAGATIMGGMVVGLTPAVAAEFSFFAAIPAMLAASTYSLWKHRADLSRDDAAIVLLGAAVAFVVALLVIAGFMQYVRTRRFRPFAIYRVLLGTAVLAVYFVGKTQLHVS